MIFHSYLNRIKKFEILVPFHSIVPNVTFVQIKGHVFGYLGVDRSTQD